MIISPKLYAETELKGKPRKEIIKRIRLMRREIRDLKKELEENIRPTDEMFPGRLQRIRWNRECIALARKAAEETGEACPLTKAEQRDIAFNASLQDLKKVTFEYSGYAIGIEKVICTVMGEKVTFRYESLFNRKHADHEPVDQEEFIEDIAHLHIGEWKRRYSDPKIKDGITWQLKFEYEGDMKPVHIHGYNSFPYNYDGLLDLLGIDPEGDRL